LCDLGYRQVLDYSNEFLDYENNYYGEKVTIVKSNKLDIIYVHRTLRRIGIDYKVFIRLYSEVEKDEYIE
jgi:hypothetical protein